MKYYKRPLQTGYEGENKRFFQPSVVYIVTQREIRPQNDEQSEGWNKRKERDQTINLLTLRIGLAFL